MSEPLPHIETPWLLEDMMNGGKITAADPNRPGQRFLICELGPHFRSKADADLAAGHGLMIQAAPAMLAALVRAKSVICVWHGPVAWDIYDRASPEMIEINAAIALATERQP